MQELHVPTRYQKFTKPLHCYRNLEQLLVGPLHVAIILVLTKFTHTK